MLEESRDEEQNIARVAALDIGKAELVCCVRVPAPDSARKRLQEVSTHSTMTRAADRAGQPAGAHDRMARDEYRSMGLRASRDSSGIIG